MPTATTTYPTIRDKWISVIQALTPVGYAGKTFELFTETDLAFRDWAESDPPACFRRFMIRRVGPREPPVVTDGSRVQLTAEAALVVAYPRAWGRFDSDGLEREVLNFEDLADDDGEQVIAAIGISGAANYVSGQSSCVANSDVEDDGDGVLFLVIELETIYTRDIQSTYNAMQNSAIQNFQYVVTAADVIAGGRTFTIVFPLAMEDATYTCKAQCSKVPTGGAWSGLEPDDDTRTTTQLTLRAVGSLDSGTIIDITVRDRG